MTDEEKLHAWDTLEAIIGKYKDVGVDIWGHDPRDPVVYIDCSFSRGEGQSLREALYSLTSSLGDVETMP